jgi:hypothetical protein
VNRSRLEQLSTALLDLHKALIDYVRKGYERERGYVDGPFELLRLLTSDPYFDWLRPLSRLLADIDELLEKSEPLSEAEAGAVKNEVKSLFEADAEVPTTFTQKYLVALQDAPAVVLAHASASRALAELPSCRLCAPTVSEILTRERIKRRNKGN